MLPEDAATGYAIPAADLLADFLIENDANDPDAGDPAGWPGWTDCDPQWALGPDPGPGLMLDVLDLVPLPGDEPYEPTLGRVDNSWVNLRRLGNQLGGILEPFVLMIILS